MDQDNLPEEFVYQAYAREKIVSRGRTAVIAPPGAGKTRPIIDALLQLGVMQRVSDGTVYLPKGPVLILCSGPAIPTWLRQIPEWSNNISLREAMYVVRGSKEYRMNLWFGASINSGTGGIYITNSSVFLRDINAIRKVQWAAIIADEYHKFMRRRKSQSFKAFKSMTRHLDVVILASGSLVSKNPASMFTAFQIIAPTTFTSYWRFVNTFCFVSDGHFGKHVGGVKNVKALQKVMDRYIAYIPKEVVAGEVPEGRRQFIDAMMTPSQEHAYNDVADDMIHMSESGQLIIAQTVLSQLIRLRQLLCCPRILDPALGMGGGFQVILEALELTPHMVIFVPFRLACEHIRDALRDEGYNANMIRGGITSEEQNAKIAYFKNTRSVLVCTISYAESFDLETCNTSYFLGYDYSLNQNEQAEGRTQRVISEAEFVTWNYIRYIGTVDEDMLMNLNEDMSNVRKILRRPQAIIDALKGHKS